MSFSDFSLDSRISAGIDSAGFVNPTPIQEQGIPAILEGRDVLGLAQTGTGKTAAFVLPILQRLLMSGKLRRTRALILAPTRELAEQTHEAIGELGDHTKVRSTSVYGGVSMRPQLAALEKGVEIVVACPGRLIDHIENHDLDLSGIEVLVLDEADRMCDMGFLPDIRRILRHLPRERQTLFFSATMPDEIRELASDILNDPVTVQIGMIAPAETVSHAIYPVMQNQRRDLLLSILNSTATGRVLVFTRTKWRARNLARDLVKRGLRAAALQGNMSQNQRQRAMAGFREGKHDILVATDIASRGIDVTDISHVINYDMPDTVDAYTHRIGRTGRAEQAGEAFTFCTPEDVEMLAEIEALLKQPIERRWVEGFEYTGKPTLDTSRAGRGGSSRGGQRERSGRSRRTSGRPAPSRSGQSRGGSRQGWKPAQKQPTTRDNASSTRGATSDGQGSRESGNTGGDQRHPANAQGNGDRRRRPSSNPRGRSEGRLDRANRSAAPDGDRRGDGQGTRNERSNDRRQRADGGDRRQGNGSRDGANGGYRGSRRDDRGERDTRADARGRDGRDDRGDGRRRDSNGGTRDRFDSRQGRDQGARGRDDRSDRQNSQGRDGNGGQGDGDAWRTRRHEERDERPRSGSSRRNDSPERSNGGDEWLTEGERQSVSRSRRPSDARGARREGYRGGRDTGRSRRGNDAPRGSRPARGDGRQNTTDARRNSQSNPRRDQRAA